MDCSIGTYISARFEVPGNDVLPIPSGREGMDMLDAQEQCQAVLGMGDHGDLSHSTLQNFL